jgi:hypothetical protein
MQLALCHRFGRNLADHRFLELIAVMHRAKGTPAPSEVKLPKTGSPDIYAGRGGVGVEE